jgi:hypothetical protein
LIEALIGAVCATAGIIVYQEIKNRRQKKKYAYYYRLESFDENIEFGLSFSKNDIKGHQHA